MSEKIVNNVFLRSNTKAKAQNIAGINNDYFVSECILCKFQNNLFTTFFLT